MPMHARAILIRREWNVGENSTQVSWPVSFLIAATVSATRYARERCNLARKMSRISSSGGIVIRGIPTVEKAREDGGKRKKNLNSCLVSMALAYLGTRLKKGELSAEQTSGLIMGLTHLVT